MGIRMKDMTVSKLLDLIEVRADDIVDAVCVRNRKGNVLSITKSDRTGQFVKHQFTITVKEEKFDV